MQVFLERYLLPVIATLTVLLVFTNPFNFTWPQRITGGLSLVFAAWFISLTVHRLSKNEPDPSPNTMSGRLTAPKAEVLLSPKGGLIPQLEIGDSGSVYEWRGKPGQPMLKFFGDSGLTIESLQGKVVVSTLIRDSYGRAVAEILRNEWKVKPSDVWDRNFDANALEVKDDGGHVVLQVVSLFNRIQIQGIWRSSNGSIMALIKSPDPQRPGGLIIQNRPIEDLPAITPIFRYPSEQHLGERIR